DVVTANAMSHDVSVFLNRTVLPEPSGPGVELAPGGSVVPEATPLGGPAPGGPPRLALPVPVAPDVPAETCPVGGLELVGVAAAGPRTMSRVRLTGVAERSLVGRSVTVLRDGRRVGTTTVRSGGAVETVVAAPKSVRAAARARYQLRIDRRRSRSLVANRRATLSARLNLKTGQMRVRGSLGRVTGRRVLTVRATPFCAPGGTTVRKIRSDRRGRFVVTLAAPAAGESALVYRVFDGGRTVTLPVVVTARPRR
ncbi:MAG: hypothetical protein WC558_16950, partial [Patulibacter sp.]